MNWWDEVQQRCSGRPAAEYHGRPRLSSDLHVYMYIKCKIIQRIPKKKNIHIQCTWMCCMYNSDVHENVPRANTWGRTFLVHATSLVWGTECSVREIVEMPTIFLVLEVKTEHGPSQTCSCTCTCTWMYNTTYRTTAGLHLPERQGTVVW